MIAQFFVAAWMLLSAVSASAVHRVAEDYTTTSTISATLTFNLTTTYVTEFTPTLPTATSPAEAPPTYKGVEVYAFNPHAPFHMKPLQALGSVFRLGGKPGTYCPSLVDREIGCPPGNITAFTGCALSAIVPGGQATYLTPDGQLKFTQAHSQAVNPPSSKICPLSFTKVNDSDAIAVGVQGFGASKLMACSPLNSTRVPPEWQVYADVSKIPTTGAVDTMLSYCYSFEAMGFQVLRNETFAAWQYI